MIIQRTTKGTNGAPTLGTMTMRDGTRIGVTLERPADDELHPCIPAGTYTVNKAIHHPGTVGQYACPELDTSALVPPRSFIQLHVGNVLENSEGCVLVGLNVSADGTAIEHSQEAFYRMMTAIGDTWPFTLTILDP